MLLVHTTRDLGYNNIILCPLYGHIQSQLPCAGTHVSLERPKMKAEDQPPLLKTKFFYG